MWIVASPLPTSFDHLHLSSAAAQAFESAYAELLQTGILSDKLPVYGVGHSMGALLSALIACKPDGLPTAYLERLSGQALVCYNSQTLSAAVPGWRQLWAREDLRPAFRNLAELLESADQSGAPDAVAALVDIAVPLAQAVGLQGAAAVLGDGSRVAEFRPFVQQLTPLLKDLASGVDDFAPVGKDLYSRLEADYPKDLPVKLVKFAGDPFDSTNRLETLLSGRAGGAMLELVELKGSHVSANFNEPMDLLDGTDALGRAAIGSDTPMDAALLRASSELMSLVEAVDGLLPDHAEDAADQAGAEMARLQFNDLTADDFRHPLDRRQTQALERIPGLSAAVRQVVSIAELALYQDNISSSVLVGKKQYPQLHAMLTRACAILAIPEDRRPEVYVRQNPIPNAYTLGVQGKRPFIVVHTALLNLFTDAELEATIAHELGHLKCEHGVWLSAANILLLGAAALPLPARVLQPVLERLQEELGAWQRAAELSCDRAAVLVMQDPWVSLSVLVKLSGGSANSSKEQIEAFLDQATRYDEARSSESPVEAMLRSALGSGRPRTHPMPVLRAREMRRWADSEQFWTLLRDQGTALEEEQQDLIPVADELSTVGESSPR